MMQLSTHFTVAEFIASDTASRRGIDNTLPSELLGAAISTALMLERIRDYLSAKSGRTIPITISSGYRCPALNMAIGSSSMSSHPQASAADIKAPEFGTPLQVAIALAPVINDLGIGQLIAEFDGWVHVATPIPFNPINRVLTIDSKGTRIGILEARKS